MSELKTWVDIAQVASGAGVILTLVGVWVGVRQLHLMKAQGITDFEDRLVEYYRQIAADLPLEALLGEDIPDQQLRAALPVFYRYFDLCNQQAFLQRLGRITPDTWALWVDGIKSNMSRPAFAKAWAEIAARAKGDFEDLRALCPPDQHVICAAPVKEAA